MSHQMTGGPPKTWRALIKATIHLDVAKTAILVASFMVMEMSRRKGYGSIPTGPVALNSFHASKFMRVKG